MQVIASMAVLTVPAMAPALAMQMEISANLVGAYITLVFIGSMLSSLPVGPLVMRHGAIRVSQASLLCSATGMALLAALPTVPSALVSAALIGIGNGTMTPASSHLLARTAPPDRLAMVFSIKQTGVPLGGALAGLVVPTLVLAVSAQLALAVVATACVACALVAQGWRAALDDDRRPRHPIAVGSVLSSMRMAMSLPPVVRLVAVAMFFAATQICLGTYLVTYLNAELGYGLVQAGMVLAAAQTSGAIGRVIWGWMADRGPGPYRTLTAVAVVMSLCSVGIAALQNGAPALLVVALAALYGATAAGWNGVFLAQLARQAPAGQATLVTGGAMTFVFLGTLLGPLVFAALSDLALTYRAGFAALALPTFWCAWQLARMKRH
jgi:MFS family permease